MTEATVTSNSSSSPWSWNCATRPPPPTSQTFLPPAAATISRWTGATSPLTKRMSAPGTASRSRELKTQVGCSYDQASGSPGFVALWWFKIHW